MPSIFRLMSVSDMENSGIEALGNIAHRMKLHGMSGDYAIIEFDKRGKYLQMLSRSSDRGALHSCCMMLDALAKMVVRLGGDPKTA